MSSDLFLIQKELPILSFAQFELALSLNETLSIMYEITFDKSSEIIAVVNEEKWNIVKTVVYNLRESLQSFIATVRASLEVEEANNDKDNSTVGKETLQAVEVLDKKTTSQVLFPSSSEACNLDINPSQVNIIAKDITEKVDKIGRNEEKTIEDIITESPNITLKCIDTVGTVEHFQVPHIYEVEKLNINIGNLLLLIIFIYLY